MNDRQWTHAFLAAPLGGLGFFSIFQGNFAGLILVASGVALLYVGDLE